MMRGTHGGPRALSLKTCHQVEERKRQKEISKQLKKQRFENEELARVHKESQAQVRLPARRAPLVEQSRARERIIYGAATRALGGRRELWVMHVETKRGK